MLDETVAKQIREAVEALTADNVDAGAWAALGPLASVGRAGADVTIDLRASKIIGGPVVIARGHEPNSAREPSSLAGLTSRQREVAILIAQGRSNAEIAAQLGIALGTTKDHVHAILTKLNLTSRTQLAAFVHGKKS